MSDSRRSASTMPAGTSDAAAPDAPDEAAEPVTEATDTPAPIVIPDPTAEHPVVPAGADGSADDDAPAEGTDADETAPRTVGQGDVEVDCPGCGLAVVGESPRPTAAWFCPRCDFPLFWASEPPPVTPPSRRARRRLPGTGGTVVVGGGSCWHCGEMNEPGVVECIRCAATLPKPVPPAVPVVEVPVPVRTPVPVRMVTWPYVAAGICGGGAIAMAITVWATGG